MLANGRPLTLEWEESRFEAIVEAWHGGSQYLYGNQLTGCTIGSGDLGEIDVESAQLAERFYSIELRVLPD